MNFLRFTSAVFFTLLCASLLLTAFADAELGTIDYHKFQTWYWWEQVGEEDWEWGWIPDPTIYTGSTHSSADIHDYATYFYTDVYVVDADDWWIEEWGFTLQYTDNGPVVIAEWGPFVVEEAGD